MAIPPLAPVRGGIATTRTGRATRQTVQETATVIIEEPLKPVHRVYRVNANGIEIRCQRQTESMVTDLVELVDYMVIREPGARSSSISPFVSEVMRDLDDIRALRSCPEYYREARRDVLIADLKSHLYTLRMRHHRDLLAGARQFETAAGMRSCAAFMIVPTHIASCTAIVDVPGVEAIPGPKEDWPPASALF